MSHDWNPGDVAEIPGVGRAIVRQDYTTCQNVWVTATGTSDKVPVGSFAEPRPLVVIDPDNTDDLDGLAVAFMRFDVLQDGWDDGPRRRRMGDALREFANPTLPKPDEPTLVAAVVEDEAGLRYIRVSESGGRCWQSVGDGSLWFYDGLDVVRVLSEGVSA